MCLTTSSYKTLFCQTKRRHKVGPLANVTTSLFEELKSTEIPNGDLGKISWFCV